MACPLSAWAGPKLLGQEPQAKALQTGLEPPPRLGTGKMGGGGAGRPRADRAPPWSRDSQVGMCLPLAQPDFLLFREGALASDRLPAPPPRGVFRMPVLS